jgi:hypothetical protein
MGLGKDAHYEADAPSHLQQVTAVYGSQHTKLFAELLKELPAQKQSQLISFLADVENHAAYPQYQDIIGRLKATGERDLAGRFEEARNKRNKQPPG